jgi:hypothetical protein
LRSIAGRFRIAEQFILFVPVENGTIRTIEDPNITKPFCDNVKLNESELLVYRYTLVFVQYIIPVFVISFVYIQVNLGAMVHNLNGITERVLADGCKALGQQDAWQRTRPSGHHSPQEQEESHQNVGHRCRVVLRGLVPSPNVQHNPCHLARNQQLSAHKHHLVLL